MTHTNNHKVLPEQNDELLFREDTVNDSEVVNSSLVQNEKPWKIMVIDDEPGIHEITKIILQDFTFNGRPLEIISGYSGEEARQQLQEHTDTAVLLLDVVMETDQEGLDVVNYAREVLDNKLVRIVLRTGQPGKSYEKEVVTTYEINGYQDKAEFTAQKCYSSMTLSLRSYADLLEVQQKSCPDCSASHDVTGDSSNAD